MSVSGKGAKAKGYKLENDIVKDLRSLGRVAGRNRLDNNAEKLCIDVISDEFKIQCKRLKNYAAINVLLDVVCKDPHDIPMLVTKADRRETVVALKWEDLLRLIK